MVLDVLLCCCHFLSCDAGRQFLRCSIPRALDTLFPAVRTRRSYFHLSRRPLGPVPGLEPIEPASRLLHPFVYSYLSLFTSISLILPTPCFVKNKNTVRRSSGMVFETRSSPYSKSSFSFSSASRNSRRGQALVFCSPLSILPTQIVSLAIVHNIHASSDP